MDSGGSEDEGCCLTFGILGLPDGFLVQFIVLERWVENGKSVKKHFILWQAKCGDESVFEKGTLNLL